MLGCNLDLEYIYIYIVLHNIAIFKYTENMNGTSGVCDGVFPRNQSLMLFLRIFFDYDNSGVEHHHHHQNPLAHHHIVIIITRRQYAESPNQHTTILLHIGVILLLFHSRWHEYAVKVCKHPSFKLLLSIGADAVVSSCVYGELHKKNTF